MSDIVHSYYNRGNMSNGMLWVRLLPTHLSNGEGPHASLCFIWNMRKNEYFDDQRLNHGTNTQLSPFTISKMAGWILIQTNTTSPLDTLNILSIYCLITSYHPLQLIYTGTKNAWGHHSILLWNNEKQHSFSVSWTPSNQLKAWDQEGPRIQEQVVAFLEPCPQYKKPWAAFQKYVYHWNAIHSQYPQDPLYPWHIFASWLC